MAPNLPSAATACPWFLFIEHHGLFLRENVWGLHSASSGEMLNGLPEKAEHDSRGAPKEADLPPGSLPRRELTPGAIDPRVTQSNIRGTICRRGYTRRR